MYISALNNNDYLKGAKQAILSIYGQEYPDIMSFPFYLKIERSIILMDYSGGLNGKLLTVINTVAQDFGDSGFYLSYPVPIEEVTTSAPFPRWYVSFDKVLDYIAETETFVYRYTHYSPQGIWGLIASNDVFGVLSGTDDFIQSVLQLAPEFSYDVNNFIIYWVEHKKRHNLNIDWISLFLKNVYGLNEAANLIRFFNSIIE